MNQPFMLLFSRNHVPATDHHFHFVTPHFEQRLNDKGRIRIDYQSAQPIAASAASEDTWLLKTLAVGSSLDVEVVRKLKDLEWPTVKSFWENQGLYFGKGYDLSPKQEVQSDATFMNGLPDFKRPENGEFTVEVSFLPRFNRSEANRPRCIELYMPPLLIVPQSPGASSTSAKSYRLHDATVFSQSYYGFSAHGLSDVWPLALLHLLTHSDLFTYYLLVTCSRMAAERRTMTKTDLENFPFPEIDLLSKRQRQDALKLSSQLETGFPKPWKAINDFIFDLYGLDKYDRQVVRDTLDVAEPYKEARDRANTLPVKDERNRFYAELQRFLSPSFDITGDSVLIDEVAEQDIPAAWYFFDIYLPSTSSRVTQVVRDRLISQVTEEANKKGCSRVIVHEKGYLLVGIIGQYRYWTLSRARLCAIDILRNHLNEFPIE